jgi:polyisoprenoid-binding protein YceI
MSGRSRRVWIIRGIIGAVALGAVAAIGVPYVYVHFINKPAPPLTFAQLDKLSAESGGDGTVAAAATGDSAAAAAVASAEGEDGTWVVGVGSEVGYRVKETLNGQATEAVGRSSTLDGSITVAGARLTSAEFSVDVTTLKSDSSRRDSQFTGRIMNAAEFPVASFTSTASPDVKVPTDGSTASVAVDGVLALHGVERPVTVMVRMRKNGDAVALQGSIPVTFADFDIVNPSIATIRTADTGEIEFLLSMKRS